MNQIDDTHSIMCSSGPDGASRSLPLQLNPAQHRRLKWLIARRGSPAHWTSGTMLPRGSRLLIVLDAPNACETEHILQSLADDAAVVIPCSADPLYDVLKKELFAFGTIGPSPTSGPHLFWWGRNSSHDLTDLAASGLPLVVSCYAPARTTFNKVRRLKLSAQSLGLKHMVVQDQRVGSWEHVARIKARAIRDAWKSTEHSVLWVEPDSILRELPLLPVSIGCDFAVHRCADGAFDGSALFFNRSPSSELLLNTWLRLCSDFPGVSDSRLLQQAWLLVRAQCEIETLWLPRTFCQNVQMLVPGDRPAVLAQPRDPIFENDLGDELPLADLERPSEAPHAQLVIPGSSNGASGPIVAILRSLDPMNNENPSRSIATVAAAFVHDSGGFSHLEIVVCRSEAAVAATIDAAQGYWLALSDFSEPFESTAFRTLGELIRDGQIAGPPLRNSEPHDAQPSPQINCRPTSVKSSGVFLMKAAGMRADARPSLFLI